MSHPNQCAVCDEAIDPYGQHVRCDRCYEPCRVCGKDVALCQHKLRAMPAARSGALRAELGCTVSSLRAPAAIARGEAK